MLTPELPECLLCKSTNAGATTRVRNSKTGATGQFHVACLKQLEIARQDRLADIAWRFDRCADGPEGFRSRLPAWDFARFDNPKFIELASPKIVAAVRPWKPGDGAMILSAKTGAGKTAATVALVHALRARAEQAFNAKLLPWFLFTTASQLNNAPRQAKFGTGESYLVDRAIGADLLILDEVGFEPLEGEGMVFEVINARDYEKKSTIVTTGLQPAEFANRYGSAAWRRLTETCDVVEDHGRKLAAVR